jgi:hypothetical protein
VTRHRLVSDFSVIVFPTMTKKRYLTKADKDEIERLADAIHQICYSASEPGHYILALLKVLIFEVRDVGRDREHLTELEVERLIKVAKANRYGHRDATMILIGFRQPESVGAVRLAVVMVGSDCRF